MTTLAILTDEDIYNKPRQEGRGAYTVRKAARAILIDKDNKIALLNLTKMGNHKLPGGGVEAGEDINLALAREIKEEVGCESKVVGEVGVIEEYRDEFRLHQYSYCYLAEVVGQKGNPEFTNKEISEGFEIIWVNDIDTAIEIMKTGNPTNYEGLFILKRDTLFLEAAKTQI